MKFLILVPVREFRCLSLLINSKKRLIRNLITELHRSPGDIEKVWADTTLANNELGWKAEKSLEETLLSAWKWEKYYRERFYRDNL